MEPPGPVPDDPNAFLRATIDALADHIAIIDAQGAIAFVNRAWDEFARRNADVKLLSGLGAGANYLEVCARAAARGAAEAAEVGEAIRAALAGAGAPLALEYPCHSPDEERWFAVQVSAFSAAGARYAVVSHRNITARRLAERAVRELNEQLEARVRARTAALVRAEDDVRRLARRLLEAEERERRALGRELHDRVGQNLSALNLNLQLIRESLSAETGERVAARIEEVQRLLQDTTREVRGVMVELRPPGLDDQGLATALRTYAERIAERYPARLAVRGADARPRFPLDTELALFRIAQEALTNVAKHARASRVEVRVESDAGRQRLVIDDDGVGFEPGGAGAASLGLATMRERAEAVGGRLTIDSAPGRGARVAVEVTR